MHLIAEFTPGTGSLADGALNTGAAGVEFLPSHRGVSGYVGPRPLPGHGAHHYVFHLLPSIHDSISPRSMAEPTSRPPSPAMYSLPPTPIGTRTS
ncbi:hypothetical protein [Leekyejoonella antrihumi]|uniref:YbhB/YbcL family Raf kinase inhibitor-like protein n=1 Tax=Leekyejoonella antrihumi TaxID=1660198 RepID=A0A563E580_9MICO|nr:hypothetical protein FGL98_05270 [Leekyejoonella antrihumi]